jgi:Mrp family chromosome partitioning ATPase
MSKNFELLQSLSKERELFDTPADLSPLPVLSALPDLSQLPSPDTSSPLRRENKEKAPEHPLLLEMEAKQRDEIMKFVQRVFLMPRKQAPRTVVFAGTEPANGCSWICCCAAEILASQIRGSICVVDANLRSPGLHQYFGVKNHHGLCDALGAPGSIRDFLSPLGRSNLWLLSCGAISNGSLSLVSSDAMRVRLEELRQCFECILIDAPALSLANDGMVLGRAADGVVLVLKADSSRRDVARKMVQDLQNAGVHRLGAILNQRTFPIPQAIYSKL